MQSEIKYIELKSGFSDNGPAWIVKVEFSKSGQTIYFDNKALKKSKSPGIGANHFDIETGEEYWVSGVKRDGQDRHWAGGGKVMIDEEVIDEYLSLVDFSIIDTSHFQVININKGFDKSRFQKIENEKGALSTRKSYNKWYWDNNQRKLVKQ